MRMWEEELTRRSLLRLGLASAAVAAIPRPLRRVAHAATTTPRLLVAFFADGGWDVTQVLDPHDPADATDGVDVDVPESVTGIPPSVLATVGGITYVSNPVARPAVDTFFAKWAGRTAVVNGINTRSTSHDQSRQLVLTGYLDPTKADFAVMAANHNGPDLPLPHLQLSGPSYSGPFAGLSSRVGGQLAEALAFDDIPSHSNPGSHQRGVSRVGEQAIRRALASVRAADSGGILAGRLAQFDEANVRGDKLVALADALPDGFGTGTELATALGTAFRAGMTTSVTVNTVGGFDTHSDNQDQNGRWDELFGFLDEFVTALAAQPGVGGGSLLDQTTIVYCSEFGRSPQLNGSNGKDHHPWTSMLFIGKGVHGGTTFGRTDGSQEGVKTSFATGRPDDTGLVIDVTNVVAGIVTLMGANAGDYLPTVKPFTAMIA
ncbi:MAG TPA: DUF1501 domain-containing protein [Candidatus Binatia bacterium]|nr:DUF1501 domain-containing protein [Candidatus Binatia bacterium]